VATNTIQFIDVRLKYLTLELSEVEKEVELYKRKHGVTDVSSEAGMYLQNSSEYQKELAKLEIELEVLNSLEKYLLKSARSNRFETVPNTLAIQDPTLLHLIEKYNELQLERERMMRNLLANNPLLSNVTEQLVSIRRKILEVIANTKKDLFITRRKQQVNAGKFSSQIQKVPLIERELLEVKRQQGIKQELYLYLLKKREEAALSLAATTVAMARVIDPATTDDLPISPKKKSVYMLAVLVGLGLPLAGLYVRNLIQNQVQQPGDVLNATSAPLLGEISRKDSNEVLVISEVSKTAIAERFRLIRTNFLYETAGKENQVLLVTSSRSGEGKTFFTINFGACLSMTGKKVVLLDFDFRNPSLMQERGRVKATGITDYLTGRETSLPDIINPFPEAPNLFAIGSGPIPLHPAELMMEPKLEQLLAALKKQFDYIIMDTAPVGQVADAFALNAYTDLMIYIIRYNYTNKAHLNLINDIHMQKKFRQSLVVLNDADKSNSYHYRYGCPEKKARKRIENAFLG
jgi:capsular exopolysaccharide synthesis family protein